MKDKAVSTNKNSPKRSEKKKSPIIHAFHTVFRFSVSECHLLTLGSVPTWYCQFYNKVTHNCSVIGDITKF